MSQMARCPGASGAGRSGACCCGVITYCDATGNCATRPNTLSTAKGYDSMTRLGSIGPDFIKDLASP
jgi:hypothetical protein